MVKVKESLPYLIISLLITVIYYEVLRGSFVLMDRDLYWFFYQNSRFLAEGLKTGHLPLWNPYTYGGEPFFAQAQPGALYPLHWLYAIFPVDELFSRFLILHVAMIGFSTVLLVRECGGSRMAATIGGIVTAFSGITASLINLQSSLFALAWLPFVSWSLIRSMRRNSIGYAFLSGMAFSMMVFVGGMEVLAMGIGLCAVFISVPQLFPIGTITTRFRRRVFLFSVSLVSLILVSAVQLIPFYELTRYSYRTEGLNIDEALTWSLHPREWFYFVLPDLFKRGNDYYWQEQNWLRTIYVGTVPLILVLVFAMRARKKALGIAAVSAGCLLLATSAYLPLYNEIVQWIPGLRSIRYPSKFLMILGVMIALASALGWDRLNPKKLDPTSRKFMARVFIGLSIASAFLLFLTEISTESICRWFDTLITENEIELPTDGFVHNSMRFLALTSLASLGVYLSMKKGAVAKIGRTMIPVLIVIDLVGASPYANCFYPKEFLDILPHRISHLQDRAGYFRIFSHSKIWERKYREKDDLLESGVDLFMPNAPMQYKIHHSQGYKVLTLARISQIIDSILLSEQPDETRLVDLLNIRYILWPEEIDSPDYRLIELSDSLFYYENSRALERSFLARDYRVCRTGIEYQAIMEDPRYDPRQLVLLDEVPALPREKAIPGRDGAGWDEEVKILRYEPERVTILVRNNTPGFLVLSDAYYPGWKATVNNRETKIYRADYAFRAVAIEAGTSVVDFRYEPESLALGATISAGSILLLTGLLTTVAIYRLVSACLLTRHDHLKELIGIKARATHE